MTQARVLDILCQIEAKKAIPLAWHTTDKIQVVHSWNYMDPLINTVCKRGIYFTSVFLTAPATSID